MKKILIKILTKLIGSKPMIQNREYPYKTTLGELTNDQVTSIYHYFNMALDLEFNCTFYPSTIVVVNKSTRNPYFEQFEVQLSEYTKVIINP